MKETIKCQQSFLQTVDNMLKYKNKRNQNFHDKRNQNLHNVNVPVHLNDLTN